MQPRSLLTADDIRSAGFRPEAGSETVDDRVAHVWYPSIRRGERWDIGLGLYAAAGVEDADRYWDGLVAELGGGDLGVERVGVGDQAIHAEGWLYVRHRGQVLWVAAEGPDPVLARWAVERLARAVCPRVPELPPAAAPPAAADPPVLGADPARSEPLPPQEPAPAPLSPPLVPPEPLSGPAPVPPGAPPVADPVPLEPPLVPPEPLPGPSPVPPGAPPVVPEPPAPVPPEPAPVAPEPRAVLPEPPAVPAEPSAVPAPAPAHVPPGGRDVLEAGGPVLRPRATAPGRYRRRHLATAGLTVLDDRLVVVDARGRDHRFALDGTAGAPAAIGLTFDPRAAVTVAYLAVLDGEGRLLVRDGEPGAWATADIRRFAEETGLRYLEPAARVDPVDWHRQPVEMEGTPWVFILLTVIAVVGAVALAVAGVPALVILAAGAGVAAVAWVAGRLTHVRVVPPEDAPR